MRDVLWQNEFISVLFCRSDHAIKCFSLVVPIFLKELYFLSHLRGEDSSNSSIFVRTGARWSCWAWIVSNLCLANFECRNQILTVDITVNADLWSSLHMERSDIIRYPCSLSGVISAGSKCKEFNCAFHFSVNYWACAKPRYRWQVIMIQFLTKRRHTKIKLKHIGFMIYDKQRLFYPAFYIKIEIDFGQFQIIPFLNPNEQ